MIVDAAVLGPVSAKWEKDIMTAPWSSIIGTWCVEYYRQYGKAPGKVIESLFETWAEGNDDKETVKIIEKLLSELSGQYARIGKESNSQYVVDLACKHFNRVKANRLMELGQGDIAKGDVDKFYERITKFNRIEVGQGTGVNVLEDTEAIRAAFKTKGQSVVVYDGALGNFFSDALERDAFVAFMGPEKSGKTWWLLDLAWRAMLQGSKVAFFEVGDLSQNQIMRRFMTRAAYRPWKAGLVKRPINITHNPDDPFAIVDFEEKKFPNDLDFDIVHKKCNELMKRIGSQDPLLKLSVHPNDSISVHGIEGIIEAWERSDGWSPDIIVVDYADILAPPSKAAETRDQINSTWKRLRALSQSRHCLVVTATQSDAASYRAELLDRSNFSEDKRKFAHVTGMVGINVTLAEKDQMLTRLNWLVLREGEYSEGKCVHAAGCLAIANPAVLSTF